MLDHLFPFQDYGASWLTERRRAYLGDEPGLGKTRTALEAARRLGVDRIAIICPAIVRPHWDHEFRAVFAPHAEHEGDFPDLAIFSYQKYVVSAASRKYVETFNPDLLILDEAHYLQNRDSRRTQLLIHPRTGLARTRPHVWCLSGTPMPRNPAQMFAVLASLYPKPLVELGIRTYYDFLNRWCAWVPTEFGPKIVGVKNPDELTAILAPFMLRRLTKDVHKELPEMRWAVTHIEATPEKLREVKAALAEIVTPEMERLVEDGASAIEGENFGRARHLLGDAKAPFAAALIGDELDSDPRAKRVVFAYHRSVLDILEEGLREFGVARIDGSTPEAARIAQIERFQTHPDVRVFLGQIQACATGITLTAADQAVIVEPSSSDVNVQASKRIHRIGQSRPCLVRMLALASTLDTPLIRNHHREVAMVEKVVGA